MESENNLIVDHRLETDKYVMFLDILGFKKKMNKLRDTEKKVQAKAINAGEEPIQLKALTEISIFMTKFTETFAECWRELKGSGKLKGAENLEGFIFSDSIIVSTKYIGDKTPENLTPLLELGKKVAQELFVKNNTLVRAGIARGSYNKLEHYNLDDVEKGLLVGQGYLEAHLLEESTKAPVLGLSKTVYEDLKMNRELFLNYATSNEMLDDFGEYALYNDLISDSDKYIYCYLTDEFLFGDNNRKNLEKFVRLAVESGWLHQYYNALYYAIKPWEEEEMESRQEANRDRMLARIGKVVAVMQNKCIDSNAKMSLFIKQAYKDEVVKGAQEMITDYIEERLFRMG